jgi:hypothetical protein
MKYNWHIDEIPDFDKKIPPTYYFESSHPARGHFLSDNNWGPFDPWLLNPMGKRQDGDHGWVSYDYNGTGYPVILIQLHMHWNPQNIDFIVKYLKDGIRNTILHKPECQLILHYAVEGFAEEIFPYLHNLANELQIPPHKILYISGSLNIEILYNGWAGCNNIPFDKQIRVGYEMPWMRFFSNSKQLAHAKATNIELAIDRWDDNISNRYLCVNRRLHPHRILLVTWLHSRNLLKFGKISMPKYITEEYDLTTTKTFINEWNIFSSCITWMDNFENLNNSATELNSSILPLIADDKNLNVNLSTDLSLELVKYPVSIITETHFFNNLAFPSEKIWKPMAYGQVFIPVASQLFCKYLRDCGFKTFDDHIQNFFGITFDDIEDHFQRMEKIVNIIDKLSNCSGIQFKQFLELCRDDVVQNRKMIFSYEHVRNIALTPIKKVIESYV